MSIPPPIAMPTRRRVLSVALGCAAAGGWTQACAQAPAADTDEDLTGITGIALSPDGRRVAGGEKLVRVWDVASGRTITTFGKVWSPRLAFSPDGRFLAAGGLGNGPRLVDVETGRDVWSAEDGMVLEMAMSPDGKAMLTSEMEHLRLWNAETGTLVRDVVSVSRGCVAFSSDGHLFAIGEEGAVQIRAVATGKLERAFKAKDTPYAVAFSPDGREVTWIVLRGTSEMVRADLARGTLATWSCKPPGRRDEAGQATLSRAHDLLALTSPTELALWRVGGNRPLWQASFEPWSDAAAATSFSADGSLLAVGAGRWDVTLRDARTGAIRSKLIR